MQRFFAPAIVLMNRMGYAKKFALLGAVSLTAIVVAAGSLHSNLNQFVDLSQRELQGVGLIGPLSSVTQGVQKHRGLSVMRLAGHGDNAVRDECAAAAAKVDAAFVALARNFPAGSELGGTVRNIKAEWESLRKAEPDLTAEASFDAHVRLIARILAFGADAADAYALTLDPEAATYYLLDTAVNKLPQAVERLGRLRAYGTGIVAGIPLTEARKLRLHVLVAELGDALVALDANLEKAGRYNPTMRTSVAAISGDIADSARRVTDFVAGDILTGHQGGDPGGFFGLATASIDRSYAQLRESVVPMAETLIASRLMAAKYRLYASVGIALLLFLVVAWLMAGIYLAIAGNIRTLARSAHAIAGGNLDERVRLDTHDELRQVGDSFNEMAVGFSALLRAQRELSAHLEDRVAERTQELEQARQGAETLLRRNQVLMNTSRDGIHIMDVQGNVVEANDAFCELLGYTREETLRLNVTDWDAHFPAAALRTAFRDLIGKSAMLETRNRRKDGTLIDVEISVAGIEIDGRAFLFAAGRDITDRKKAEAAVHDMAFHDPLTGLPNRRLLMERLRTALHASARYDSHGAVMFIDLDRFKLINDTLGHECGDLMLQEVARRIKSVVRETDTVSRLGGDEFIVLAENIGAGRDEAARRAELVAEKIREALVRPYRLNAHEHHSSPSIGICLYHGNRESVDALLQHADTAMYVAKESGRNAVRFFEPPTAD